MSLDEERLARVVLSQLVRAGDPETHREIAVKGVVVAAEKATARRRKLAEQPALWPAEGAAEVAFFGLREAERVVAGASAAGIRLLCPGDPEWPPGLQSLGGKDEINSGEPFALWVRGAGSLAELCQRAVAIVGSRAASAYGDHMAAVLSGGVADAGWTVVSGGAYGIDAAAHRAALAAGGPTVAVLAGGVDVAYPAGNAQLLERVSRSGALVSEVPPGASPRRHRFLSRNRLIAAITGGTVIVEAGLRSGALNTARHASRLDRRLMGVPGPATSAASAGVHAMLRADRETRLVTTPEEVLEEIGPIGMLAPVPRAPSGPRDALRAATLEVLDAVPAFEPASAAAIGLDCGQPVETIARILAALVGHGLVEQVSAGYRLTELGREPAAANAAAARAAGPAPS